ncbi:MAG: M20/M25/M40 family metallo-hydrolase, partial [Cyclobacteriaceae bacterium]|nr:M20/M25/M40 family metallo-hydrolase [Cyclobacteriaceae bacterium]
FAGTGTEEDLEQIDVTDKIVFIFHDNMRATYAISKILQEKKAFCLLVANPKNEKQFIAIKQSMKEYVLQKRLFLPDSDTIRNFLFSKLGMEKKVNTILIPNEQIKNILGDSEKELFRLINEKRIDQAPIGKLKLRFEKVEREVETSNVLGFIKGKSDKTIALSAHYDHLGKASGVIFPGADDNASGVAALLELAEQFSQAENLKYNLLFIATTAEEAGLLGSQFHVNQSAFDPQKIVYNFNFDMIARTDDKHKFGNYLYCIGTTQSKEIDKQIRRTDELYDQIKIDFSLNESEFSNGLFSRSDNYNFYRKGIPSIQFFSGLHPDYHKPTDTIEKINFDNLSDRVRFIALLIEQLQSEDKN